MVLRIDVDDPKSRKYAIPPSNPYVKRTKAGKLTSRGGFLREGVGQVAVFLDRRSVAHDGIVLVAPGPDGPSPVSRIQF